MLNLNKNSCPKHTMKNNDTFCPTELLMSNKETSEGFKFTIDSYEQNLVNYIWTLNSDCELKLVLEQQLQNLPANGQVIRSCHTKQPYILSYVPYVSANK